MKNLILSAWIAGILLLWHCHYAQAQWGVNHIQKCVGIGTSSPMLGNSLLYDNGLMTGIGTTSPQEMLDVAGNIRSTGRFISVVPNGTPPFNVASSTLVQNLNCDMLDGKHASWFSAASHTHQGMVTGSGVSSRIAFWNSTSGLSSDVRLFWNSTAGRLGIGTSQPSASLHVVSAQGSAAALRLETSIQNPDPMGPPVITSYWEFRNTGTGLEFSANALTKFFIGNNGRVGIGTIQPAAHFEVAGTIKTGGLCLASGAGTGKVLLCGPAGMAYWAPQSALSDGDWTKNGPNIFRNTGTVNIGSSAAGSAKLNITALAGTAVHITSGSSGWGYAQLTELNSPQVAAFAVNLNGEQKLVIWGDGRTEIDNVVRSKEVEVMPDVWPDFVFEPGYSLPGLKEVETYIKNYGHLPGIPSAEQVLEQGVALGNMSSLLLKKVEELTLYIIELEKRMNELEQEKSKQ